MARSQSLRSPNRSHDRDCFYKYVTADVAKIILTTRRLRWSSPVQFNDPFDVTQVLRLNFTAAELNFALMERFATCIENGMPLPAIRHPLAPTLMAALAGASAEQRALVVQGLRDGSKTVTPGQVEALALLEGKWAEIVPKFRILCFSEAVDIVPLWAHYANQQRGVVLEFSAVDEVDSAFLTAQPVTYQDAIPSIASADQWVSCLLGLGGVTFMDLFFEYLYVKTSEWSSEKEWRIVSTARPGEVGLFQDYGFHPRELTGIYFGSLCSAEDRAALGALLSHGLEHVHSYQAVLDYPQAKIRFTETAR